VLQEEKCFQEGEQRAERSFRFHLKIAQNKMINNC
jgi:2'-5' RNA ligase